MFTYSAYGLSVRSPLFLPEFVPGGAGTDVLIYLDSDPDLVPWWSEKEYFFDLSPQEAVLFYKDVGAFRIRGGCEIAIAPAPGIEDALIRLYLTGIVMAILMYQRGHLVLHASTVSVDGNGVAFLGPQGRGKSSIAAAHYGRGHGIVSDDVTVVSWRNGQPMVCPAFPQIKLDREMALSLGYEPDSMIFLHSSEEKLGLRVEKGFPKTPVPLNHIYVLTGNGVETIELLDPQEALLECVRHSFPTRFLQHGGASHFLKCAMLVKSVHMYRISKLKSDHPLPAAIKMIQDHTNKLINTD